MSILEIALIGVALAMDAFAAGLTDGMSEPGMPPAKLFFIAFLFGAFQFLMPVLGYYCSSAFSDAIGKVAPWLSFAILAFLGGKAFFSGALGGRGRSGRKKREEAGVGTIFAQAVATSLDALAVGVSLLAEEASAGLPMHILLCALVIGVVTFLLSAAAVGMGRRVGDKFADGAESFGGAVLFTIGLKILLEGVL